MKPSSRESGPPHPAPPFVPDEESPSVPGFRTWSGLYTFVLAFFLVVVALLALFSRHFS